MLISLRLDSLAFGGEAVGRDASGRVVFVAGGAPGDWVEARVVEAKRRFARAELVRVVEPGARVTPPCALASRCGGCPWQHVEPAAQLAAKQSIVERALAGIEVRQIAAAPAWLGYRVRARMTRRAGALGFAARRSHQIVDVDHRPALEPALDGAMQEARAALGAALGEEGTLSGLVAPDGRVQLAVEPGRGADGRALEGAAKWLVGRAAIAGVTVAAQRFGAGELDLGGVRASADGFAQANHAQNETLRRLVADAVRAAAPARLLELYAGAGNFTRDLMALSPAGVAVEGAGPAAARLRALVASYPGWSARAEPAEKVVRQFAAAGERFDVVVLDPPRAGAAELSSLAALGPARIVYVSCDPMTLARDVEQLAALGYGGGTAQPLDMMPHTAHVEVLCVLDYMPQSTRVK